jgi:hypothetical protein
MAVGLSLVAFQLSGAYVRSLPFHAVRPIRVLGGPWIEHMDAVDDTAGGLPIHERSDSLEKMHSGRFHTREIERLPISTRVEDREETAWLEVG